MIFEQGPYGWSESYYRNNPSATLITEMAALKLLADKRIKLSGAQTKLSWLKVSNEEIDRDVLVYSYGAETGVLPTGDSRYNSDSRFAALICKRANINNTAVSNLLLRGLWDELVVSEGFASLNSNWVAAWGAFLAVYIGVPPIVGAGWGFGAKNPATSAKLTITNVTQAATGQINFTTVEIPPGAPANETKHRVFISGVQGAATLNGQQVIVVKGDRSFQTVNRLPMLPYLGLGKVTWNTNEFYEITQVQALRTTERKTGRPLYLSRGRSRVRKLA
jgi:hypothetical protein